MSTKLMFALIMGTCLWIGCAKPRNPVILPVDYNKPQVEKPGITCELKDSLWLPVEDCGTSFCTKQFVSVPLQVIDKSGKPVVLDSFYTVTLAGAKLPTDLYSYDPMYGSYTVVNDMWVGGHQRSTSNLRFVGFKNGRQTVNELYIIDADCCHISKRAGAEKVVLP